jgi:hypothetical protein
MMERSMAERLVSARPVEGVSGERLSMRVRIFRDPFLSMACQRATRLHCKPSALAMRSQRDHRSLIPSQHRAAPQLPGVDAVSIGKLVRHFCNSPVKCP